MKKILYSILAGLLGLSAYAQESRLQDNVQMAVYLDESQNAVPQNVKGLVEARLKTILSKNMMGASGDFCQFFVTCDANKVESDILPGAPTKYRDVIEVNFYVIDALAEKLFASESISVRAVANSEQKAYTDCFRQISTDNKKLNEFFRQTSKNIISYYNSQYANIITMAMNLAKVMKYDEALFRLSMVPEACEGYMEVVTAATGIYQKYIDHEAQQNLMKASAIWAASQDSDAAYEAAELLSSINPEASCYAQALELLSEIKAGVKDNIQFERRIAEKLIDNDHAEKMASVDAWKAVGVAYGNHQQAHTYHNAYMVR